MTTRNAPEESRGAPGTPEEIWAILRHTSDLMAESDARMAPGRRGSGNDGPEREAERGRRERLGRRDTGRQTLEQKLTRRRWLERHQNQQKHQLKCRQTESDPDAGREMEPVAGSQSSLCHRLVHFGDSNGRRVRRLAAACHGSLLAARTAG